MRKHTLHRDKIFPNHVSDRQTNKQKTKYITNQYLEYLKTSQNLIVIGKNSIRKWAKNIHRHFTEEDIQTVIKGMKRY